MAAIDYLLPRREHPALPALRHAEVVPLTDKRVVGPRIGASPRGALRELDGRDRPGNRTGRSAMTSRWASLSLDRRIDGQQRPCRSLALASDSKGTDGNQ